PSPVHHRVHLDPSPERRPASSVLLDKRMAGAHRPPRPTGRHRTDRAGLVLSRRARRRARAHHRPGLLRSDWRARSLALSPGAQAWRSPARRLALRLPPPPPEIRQSLALQALRLRAAPYHPPPAAARLYALSRS